MSEGRGKRCCRVRQLASVAENRDLGQLGEPTVKRRPVQSQPLKDPGTARGEQQVTEFQVRIEAAASLGRSGRGERPAARMRVLGPAQRGRAFWDGRRLLLGLLCVPGLWLCATVRILNEGLAPGARSRPVKVTCF